LKISAAIVGCAVGPQKVAVDRRWIMAYNAALGEVSAAPHPLFPVCYEWPANTALREASGLQALNAQLVHAQHDLVLHREILSGEILSVTAKVVAATQRRPGAFVVLRMEARGAGGEPVSTSDYGMLYRGVALEGGARAIETLEDPPRPEGELPVVAKIPVAATAAHVYTECARIWNPIHTDPDYARAAGLPGIILHGTATLAFSLSKALQAFKADPLTVRRVRCRFGGMVLMPNTLQVFGAASGNRIFFETQNAAGEWVVSRAIIDLDG
jgi:acyl dehydratase